MVYTGLILQRAELDDSFTQFVAGFAYVGDNKHNFTLHEQSNGIDIQAQASESMYLVRNIDYIVKMSTYEYNGEWYISASWHTAYTDPQTISLKIDNYINRNFFFPELSGFVGVINNGYDIEVKSLFVSGSPIYTDSWNFTFVEDNTILNDTTISDITPSPTVDLDPAVNVQVAFDVNNVTNTTDEVIVSITHQVITNTLEIRNISCYKPDRTNVSVIIVQGNNTQTAVVDAEIVLCNATDQEDLVAHLDNNFKDLLATEIKKNGNIVSFVEDSTLISITTLSVIAVDDNNVDTISNNGGVDEASTTKSIGDNQLNDAEHEGLSDVALILLVIGSIVFFCIVLCLIVFGVKFKQAKEEKENMEMMNVTSTSSAGIGTDMMRNSRALPSNSPISEDDQKDDYIMDLTTQYDGERDMVVDGNSDDERGKSTPSGDGLEDGDIVLTGVVPDEDEMEIIDGVNTFSGDGNDDALTVPVTKGQDQDVDIDALVVDENDESNETDPKLAGPGSLGSVNSDDMVITGGNFIVDGGVEDDEFVVHTDSDNGQYDENEYPATLE